MLVSGRLSVVIPAFNEADRIGPTLQSVLTWVGENAPDFEILVVDDGSTDDTAAVVASVVHPNNPPAAPTVAVLSNGANRGKGYSVAHGVSRSTGDLVLFSDADLSTPIEDCAVLLEALRGADIAIGSRALPKSNVVRRQPKYRESMGRIFNRVVQLLVIPGIRDTQCGFKLFRGAVARDLFTSLSTDGFAFDVEVLMRAQRRGYRIVEAPVTWINDERTTVHAVYDSLRMLRDVVRLRTSRSD